MYDARIRENRSGAGPVYQPDLVNRGLNIACYQRHIDGTIIVAGLAKVLLVCEEVMV